MVWSGDARTHASSDSSTVGNEPASPTAWAIFRAPLPTLDASGCGKAPASVVAARAGLRASGEASNGREGRKPSRPRKTGTANSGWAVRELAGKGQTGRARRERGPDTMAMNRR